MNDVFVLAVSVILAGFLGFGAHRASVCTVGAVAEVLSTGRAYMFLGFLKTSLWVVAIMVPVVLFLPGLSNTQNVWELSWLTVLGGFMFGMGAALNKGCTFSLLTRLMDGQVSMLLTVAGIGLGVLGYLESVRILGQEAPRPFTSPYLSFGPWLPILATLTWLWAIQEIARLWRTRPTGESMLGLFFSERYRLATAAMIMGLSNGLLYAIHGPWAYTRVIEVGIGRLTGQEIRGLALLVILVVAVMLGMLLSSWQRGSFRLQWRPSPSWFLNLLGGSLMGAGAAMAHGGNNVLILHGIPGLSPHALPTYLAIVVGIALPLALMKWWQGRPMGVDCAGDVCCSALLVQAMRNLANGARPAYDHRRPGSTSSSNDARAE